MTPAAPRPQRTPARRKARQLAKYLRAERPDYTYLKALDLVRRYQQLPGRSACLTRPQLTGR